MSPVNEFASPSLVGGIAGSAVHAAEKTRGRSDFVGRSSRYIQICRCAAGGAAGRGSQHGCCTTFQRARLSERLHLQCCWY